MVMNNGRTVPESCFHENTDNTMVDTKSRQFSLKFPGDLEYIPSVRKFVSEVLLASNFDAKFAYRSEIIVDEICNNAVSYGCIRPDASIDLGCSIFGDRIEFTIRDEGGKKDDIVQLELAVKNDPRSVPIDQIENGGKKTALGLEIVRMLSKDVTFEVDKNNLTSIRVVKVREDEPNAPSGSTAS
jgi:anti-sigma regulatory factor (Ser/Thr protein kinase)